MKTTAQPRNAGLSVIAKVFVAALAVGACGAASAQTAGTWLVKVGVNQITPKISSGDLSAPSMPGTQVDINSATSAIFTIGRMITDNIGAELFLGLPYKHDIVGRGAIDGVGKIGEVKQMPPTFLFQYRFLQPTAAFRPYVGAGLTYAHFYDEQGTGTLTALTNPGGGTKLRVDDAWGATGQIGGSYALNEKWFVDACVQKTIVTTSAHLSTGQSIDTRLNPVSVNFSIGYRY